MSDPASAFRPGNGMPDNTQPGGAAPRGERRIVTALFCDVANSTALAAELDHALAGAELNANPNVVWRIRSRGGRA
jgi:class 3 adenylate cyclase